MRKFAARGFTLVELMIGIAILAILLTLGMPSFTQFLANTKIRNTAESIQNGLQLARGQAVQRNNRVDFALTAQTAVVGNINSVENNESAGRDSLLTGSNWMVRSFQATGTYTAADFVQGANSAEGASGITVTSTKGMIVFNGFGRTDLAANATIQVTYPAGGTCIAAGGTMRCLNVVVQPGGQMRMCDPSIATTTDTRAC